jgi:hypothetical protein
MDAMAFSMERITAFDTECGGERAEKFEKK